MNATTEDIRVCCAVCRTEADARLHTFGDARWLALDAGWWVLLDCLGGDPHVRCRARRGCLVSTRPVPAFTPSPSEGHPVARVELRRGRDPR